MFMTKPHSNTKTAFKTVAVIRLKSKCVEKRLTWDTSASITLQWIPTNCGNLAKSLFLIL